ncbi:MAG TPA: hypothetical protein VF715_13845 [Thermoleophilaceae bacterium]|jgi:hypothetical protein
MGWGFVWMMVVLKIPIVALLWLVWWAIKQSDMEIEQPPEGGGGSDRHPHRGGPRRPRPPRRGPHAEPAPAAPKRVRATGRQLTRPLR